MRRNGRCAEVKIQPFLENKQINPRFWGEMVNLVLGETLHKVSLVHFVILESKETIEGFGDCVKKIQKPTGETRTAKDETIRESKRI